MSWGEYHYEVVDMQCRLKEILEERGIKQGRKGKEAQEKLKDSQWAALLS